MPHYRRFFLPGGTYFFTLVTYQRRPILCSDFARDMLRAAWLDVQGRFPFTTAAVCLLPDHLHCIWTLPEDDYNYSVRWKEIKRLFSKAYGNKIIEKTPRSNSREKRGELSIWQRRFWEHTIRDEADLEKHIEYIHYNPVKHGLVENLADWPWSSFHRYVRSGYYDANWGAVEPGEFPSIGSE